MPTFSSAQVTSPFLSTDELLAPMAAYDTHQNQLLKQQADTIANAYAPQRNQLFLDTGAIANQFATAKNPLEIQSLRQQLGLDEPEPAIQIMRLFSGDGTGRTSQPPGAAGPVEQQPQRRQRDRDGGRPDRRTRRVRDGLIKRRMQPDGATAFAANALHNKAVVHRRGRRGGLTWDFSMERRSARGVQGG